MVHRPLVWHEQLSRGMYVRHDQSMGGPAALLLRRSFFNIFFFLRRTEPVSTSITTCCASLQTVQQWSCLIVIFIQTLRFSDRFVRLKVKATCQRHVHTPRERENDYSHQYARGKMAKCYSVLVIKWFSLCFDDDVGNNNTDRNNALGDGDDDNDDTVDTD